MKRRTRIKLYKPRKIYKLRQTRRGRRKPYIKKIYIYILYILEAVKSKRVKELSDLC